MATDKEKKIAEFPDVENKLHAPTKKSLFERQKAEAEAKRQREEAETKAVYDDFLKSFDQEDGDEPLPGSGFAGGDRGGVSGPPKRHYSTPAGRGSGRGSGPGSLGPPQQTGGRKRAFEAGRGVLAFNDYEEERERDRKVFKHSDDEDEGRGREEVAKPTLRLASLPPGTSPAVIKALLPPNLTVDAVRILPSTGPGTYMERKSMSAIVTLAKDTAANDIDATVNSLQNRYLGFGHYLTLHRHLSSAAISSSASLPALGSSTASQPFGAKQVVVAPAGRGHAPPPHQRGGFAPPSSYGPAVGRGGGGPLMHVPVQAPRDIKELKLIHKTIESLLGHGPEFEALLMSRPEVQREEKWAWLWDARSTGGVWYRWRLWEVLTGSITKRGQGKYLPLFEGSSAWKAPDQPLAYEYTTKLDEFVSDSEYNSSDEDDSGDEGTKRQHHAGAPPDTTALLDDGKTYLNPLEKSKLTHLLSRLPTSTGKLRKGDIARITAFAISHAGRGADEVVSMIVSNILTPFAYTSANPRKSTSDENEESDSDTSSASLIGIFVVSDILSSSSTSGVRHAWRYRQLFESALRQQQVFEGLGRMETKMKWGRLRAEKWKRSVQNILGLWEGWCVFPQEVQEGFAGVFGNPPLTQKEEEEARRKEEEERVGKGKGRWKAVEVTAKEDMQAETEGLDGEVMEEDDEDVDGVPMEEEDEDEDVDGEPMEEDGDVDGEPMEEDVPPVVQSNPAPVGGGGGGGPRRRPRAVDMFADSDDDDN